MKTSLLLLALASHALATTPITARVTPADLAKLQQQDPMSRLVQSAEADINREAPQATSIIDQSTLISDGSSWTLVPKGAMVFLPPSLKNRVVGAPTGSLLPWAEFLTKNRNWITTYEVTIDQATGSDLLPASRVTFWSTQDKIVVAVHRSGPISVKLPGTPATAATR